MTKDQVTKKKAILKSGWAVNHERRVFHFEHIPKRLADRRCREEEKRMYVVEVINPVYARDEVEPCYHLEKYYTYSQTEAIQVVIGRIYGTFHHKIRAATQQECVQFMAVEDHFFPPLGRQDTRTLRTIDE